MIIPEIQPLIANFVKVAQKYLPKTKIFDTSTPLSKSTLFDKLGGKTA
jgi:hypothetical protein